MNSSGLGLKKRNKSRKFTPSSHFTRLDSNSSIRITPSQGDLLNRNRTDDNENPSFLKSNSLHKSSFSLNRKISLKVDGQGQHEGRIFLLPQNSSLKKFSLDDKICLSNNFDQKISEGDTDLADSMTLNWSGVQNYKKHSRSLQNSTKKHINKTSIGLAEDFPINRSSVQRDKQFMDPRDARLRRDINVHEKKPSDVMSDNGDFNFSCVNLKETKENHFYEDSNRGETDRSNVNTDSLIFFKTSPKPELVIPLDSPELQKSELIQFKKKQSDTNKQVDWLPSKRDKTVNGVLFENTRKISGIPIRESFENNSMTNHMTSM